MRRVIMIMDREMIMKAVNDTSTGLKNTNYLVWKITRERGRQHDRDITKLYNSRARQRPETRH